MIIKIHRLFIFFIKLYTKRIIFYTIILFILFLLFCDSDNIMYLNVYAIANFATDLLSKYHTLFLNAN